MQINLSFDPSKMEEVERVHRLVSSLLGSDKPVETKPAENKKEVKKIEATSASDVTVLSDAEIVTPKKETKETKAEKSEVAITDDDMRRLGAQISAAKKTAEIKKLLADYGFERLTTVTADKRKEFYEKAMELVA